MYRNRIKDLEKKQAQEVLQGYADFLGKEIVFKDKVTYERGLSTDRTISIHGGGHVKQVKLKGFEYEPYKVLTGVIIGDLFYLYIREDKSVVIYDSYNDDIADILTGKDYRRSNDVIRDAHRDASERSRQYA